ncbi:SMI1/KNR4 family protein [Streptomyces sp. NPDC057307]|uniref:SMI1/KNR4 family protein n=1 Tax=Streptomyces sp. NPDC057307 TaxID=3346096 RepID=UPI00362C3AC5
MARYDEVRAAFWDNSGGDQDGERPPLTGELVAEAERVLGVTLPVTLLDLLRVRDGGAVAPAWNALPTGELFTELMGIGRLPTTATAGPADRTASVAPLCLLDTPYLVAEWELPSPIVLIAGEGHWWIGLDYRECGPRGEPSVTWFDADEETELALATDFRSFVEGLVASGDPAATARP